MELPDLRQSPDPGMLGCDRALFAQVWGRVAPGPDSPVEPDGPCEVPTPMPEPPEPMPGPACPLPAPVCPEPEGVTEDLPALIRAHRAAARCYRALAARGRRREQLLELARCADQGAGRLSAACFLETGVRCRPQLPRWTGDLGFFPGLRERYFAEEGLARRLDALVNTAAVHRRELFASLAQDARDRGETIRRLLEQES